MSELKIGDEVFNLRTVWGEKHYAVDTIVRATSTQIILMSGVRLRRNADSEGRVSVVGNPHRKYEKLTPKIRVEIEAAKHQNKVNHWFSSKKFTPEEKRAIYDLFFSNKEGVKA